MDCLGREVLESDVEEAHAMAANLFLGVLSNSRSMTKGVIIYRTLDHKVQLKCSEGFTAG